MKDVSGVFFLHITDSIGTGDLLGVLGRISFTIRPSCVYSVCQLEIIISRIGKGEGRRRYRPRAMESDGWTENFPFSQRAVLCIVLDMRQMSGT